MVLGGEVLKIQSLKPWFDARSADGARLINMYGITETTVHSTYRPIEPSDIQNGRSVIGLPLPDMKIYLLDDHMMPVPPGLVGEIYIGGAGISPGYSFRPELSADRFRPDPFGSDPGGRLYRSGDIARWLESGEIEYIGRRDHQVKIRGYRIELGEIEFELENIPGIKQAAVIHFVGKTDHDQYETNQLIAYLVADDPLPIRKIRSHLAARLPEYMLPSYYFFLSEFPLTANGKVDQNALPSPRLIDHIKKDLSNSTLSLLEKALIRVWVDILELTQADILSNFFELGGDSLSAIRLTNRINQIFQLELSPVEVFSHQTPAEYAELLRERFPKSARLDETAAVFLDNLTIPTENGKRTSNRT